MDEEELLEVVDENNLVIGREARGAVHRLGFFHRGVYVVLFNSERELLIQKRVETKKVCPSCWDLSVAEHLKPQETYEQAAARGLAEELGVSGVELELLRPVHLQKKDYADDIKDYEFVALYSAVFGGKIVFDASEVSETKFASAQEITAMLAGGEFAPWFLDEWAYLQSRPNLLLLGRSKNFK